MNRPNIKDYKNYEESLDVDKNYDVHNFLYDLEKYCDVLEKALDKACELLQDIEKDNCVYCPVGTTKCVDTSERYFGAHCKKENWKEWSLKNE